jgi:hypothetical protein
LPALAADLVRRLVAVIAAPGGVATLAAASAYPAPVRSWIVQHEGLTSKVIVLRGQELASLYPRCS